MNAYVAAAGGTPPRIAGSVRERTCVIGEFEGGGRMVAVVKWRDVAIAEEYKPG